jgi:hypothetical protein
VALEAELASVEGYPRQSNSIEELANSLSRIMKEMAQGGCVPQNIMQDTQGHMTSLLAGLSMIAAETRKGVATVGSAANNAATEKGVAPAGTSASKHVLETHEAPQSKLPKVESQQSRLSAAAEAPLPNEGDAAADLTPGNGLALGAAWA